MSASGWSGETPTPTRLTVTGANGGEPAAVDHVHRVAVAEGLADAQLRRTALSRGQARQQRRGAGVGPVAAGVPGPAQRHPDGRPRADQRHRGGRRARPHQRRAAGRPRPDRGRAPPARPRRRGARRDGGSCGAGKAASESKPGRAVCDPDVASSARRHASRSVRVFRRAPSSPSASASASAAPRRAAGQPRAAAGTRRSAPSRSPAGRNGRDRPRRTRRRTGRAGARIAASVGRSRGTRSRQAADQPGQFRGHAGQVGRLGREPDEDVHHGLAAVRRVAGGGEHERRAEREDVAGRRGLRAVPGLLGRHVSGGARRPAGDGELNSLGGPGHAEVDDPRAVRAPPARSTA